MDNRAIGTLEQQYRATLDSLGDAILVIDNNFKIILTNTALELWLSDLGLRTEILGLDFHEAIPFFSERVYHEYRQVFRTGATHVAKINYFESIRLREVIQKISKKIKERYDLYDEDDVQLKDEWKKISKVLSTSPFEDNK